MEPLGTTKDTTEDKTCCPPPAARAVSRGGVLSAVGAVVSAVLASACCWLPLLLIAFGASAASVSGFFEQYRIFFLLGATGLLGLGFYFVYFRKSPCAPDGTCPTPNRRLQRLNKIVLWIATVLVVVAGAFPKYVGVFLGRAEHPPSALEGKNMDRAVYSIKGMTCEACAVTIRSELEKLPGVSRADVSFERKEATIFVGKGSRPVSDAAVFEAIRHSGYEAQRVSSTETGR